MLPFQVLFKVVRIVELHFGLLRTAGHGDLDGLPGRDWTGSCVR